MERQAELLGLAEVAVLLGVSRQSVANWRLRQEDFPVPMAELKSGPVWQFAQIADWAKEHDMALHYEDASRRNQEGGEGDARVARTVALSNMKGGVGKSTLTANLAWYCAQRKNKRVLVVDLDPQFNLSQYIMGVDAYEKHYTSGKGTVLDIFVQGTPPAVSGAPRKELRPDDIVLNIRKPYGGGRLDLIPSRLDLAWTLKNTQDKAHLLSDFLDDIKAGYDLILIDCAPTESILTTAAYLASDAVLIPVRPEFLSTIGLPLLAQSLADFRQTHKKKTIEVMGIVFNASLEKKEHGLSREYVGKVAQSQKWYVFENEVTYSDSYPKGSRAGTPIFMTDYARASKVADFVAVAEEFAARVGL